MRPSAGEHAMMQHSHTAAGNVKWFKWSGKMFDRIDRKPKRQSVSDSASLFLQCTPSNNHTSAQQYIQVKAVHQVFIIVDSWTQPRYSRAGDWPSSVLGKLTM